MHLALEPQIIPSEYCSPSFTIHGGMLPTVKLCVCVWRGVYCVCVCVWEGVIVIPLQYELTLMTWWEVGLSSIEEGG